MRRHAIEFASSAAEALGLSRRLLERRRRNGDFRLVLFEYHRVTPKAGSSSVAANLFRKHVAWLKTRFQLRTLADAADILHTGTRLEDDVGVITFDDGYLDNYEVAWPILREAQAPATFFVATDFLDGHDLWFDFARRGLHAARSCESPTLQAALERRFEGWPTPSRDPIEAMKRMAGDQRESVLETLRRARLRVPPGAPPMTWAHAREIGENGGEIGCHTASHPILSTLSATEQQREISRSNSRIESELGHPPLTFAVPNGGTNDFDEDTLRILRAARFRAACTTVRGSNRTGCDPLLLHRIGVGNDSCSLLAARCAGLFDDTVRNWFRRQPVVGGVFKRLANHG